MQHRNIDLFMVIGSAGVLAASFMAFATTKSESAYISLAHMTALFYLLPVLGLVSLVFAVLHQAKKMNAAKACLGLGVALLLLTLYTGAQARNQLDGFVYMHYEMQAKKVRFDAEFNARQESFNENFGSKSATGINEAKPVAKTPAVPSVDQPIVISDADTSTFGFGLYLSMLASLLLSASSSLALKTAKNN